MSRKSAKGKVVCSFCGQSQDEVEVLIVSSEAYICSECVGTCNEIIEDYRKRRTTIEVLDKVTEPQLVRFLIAEKHAFRWTLDFMLRGAFDHRGPVFIPPKPDFDTLLIALEVSREELQLSPDQAPGDIDILIIPQSGDALLYDKTIAIEVKIVRPTIEKPSRNANSLGETQSKKLARGGFPYVGLLHLIIPEPSPEYMLDELTVETVPAPKGEHEPSPRKEKIDLFPIRCAQRQLGRLRKLRIPDYVGFNSVDLSIHTKVENERIYLGIAGFGLQNDKEAKRNPDLSQELLDKIKKHFASHTHRYLNVKWFDDDVDENV